VGHPGHPSDFAENQPPVRLTLVAALAWCRTAEITDALVDLLISPTRVVQGLDHPAGRGQNETSRGAPAW
jgi:hypothetical protein